MARLTSPTGQLSVVMAGLIAILASFMVSACDSNEDPYLLNPPPPDSSRVRVVNLIGSESIDASIPGYAVAQSLGSLSASNYTSLLIQERTSFYVRRPLRAHTDTLDNQILARGSRVTYLILPRGDTATQIVTLAVGKLDAADLATRKTGLLGFVNAVDDTTILLIKSGCQSGDTIVPGLSFARTSTLETDKEEMSIYLFRGTDPTPVTSARVPTKVGTISHVIAANTPAGIKLFLLTSNGFEFGGPLVESPPETRTGASVSLLNALFEEVSVSARLESGSAIASAVLPRTLSAPVDIVACSNPDGDRLVVTSATGDSTSARVKLRVGGSAVVAVYDRLAAIKTLVLERGGLTPAPGTISIRCVNLSTLAGNATVSIGAGSPDTVSVESRPFGSLALGAQSNFVTLSAGDYPFMLTSATDGSYFSGGRSRLSSGRWTLLIVDRLGRPTLLLLDDQDPNKPLIPLDKEGVRGTLLNVIPDARVSFTVDGVTLPSLAYGYVSRTVIPLGTPTIGSNVGSVAIDPSLGGQTIAATTVDGVRSVIAFSVAANPPAINRAGIRFLNLATNSGDLQIHEGAATAPVFGTVGFGIPSQSINADIRKYSFVVTSADSVEVLAETDGVEFSAGRRYVMVIAPKRIGSTLETRYSIIWIQE